MLKAKLERMHIGFFGRMNVGKSSIINLIANQNVSIVSNIAGTTTDSVEKIMELVPLGPVVLIDTAGMDDFSILGEERKKKTNNVFRKCDFAFIIVEPNIWSEYEDEVVNNLKYFDVPYAIIINKIDNLNATDNFNDKLITYTKDIISVSATCSEKNIFIKSFTEIISNRFNSIPEINMFDGLLESGDVCLFVTPIDTGTPKGRMILPQVQALRAILDMNSICLFVQLAEYQKALLELKTLPKLIVADSQVIKEVIELSFPDQNITTFSILFARLKGDFRVEIQGAYRLNEITEKDIILIAEACSHHAQKDDIARVKLPALLKKHLKFTPQIEHCNGRDFPDDIEKYNLIIHCGACMLTHKEKLNRVKIAIDNDVPITNFGMAISFLNGYMDRVLSCF